MRVTLEIGISREYGPPNPVDELQTKLSSQGKWKLEYGLLSCNKSNLGLCLVDRWLGSLPCFILVQLVHLKLPTRLFLYDHPVYKPKGRVT